MKNGKLWSANAIAAIGFATLSITGFAPASLAQAAGGKLPIATGFWIFSDTTCSGATSLTPYDGKNWGDLTYYGPNGSLGPMIESEPIIKVTKLKDGFYDFQRPDPPGLGYFRIRPVSATRIVFRVGAPSRDSFDVDDSIMNLCTFAQLSPKMQAAVRKHMPAMAPAASTAVTAPATAARPANAARPAWALQKTSGGALIAALTQPTSVVRQFTIGCMNGKPTVITQLAMRRGNAANLTLASTEVQAGVPLARNGASAIWIGSPGDDRLPRLLTGSAASATFGVSGEAGGTVSLAGARDAVGKALAACWKAPAQLAAKPSTPEATAPAGNEDAAIRAMFARGYAVYRNSSGDSAFEMSPELSRLIDRATAKDGLDFDPFCGCQDFDEKRFAYRIKRLVANGSRADVDVDVQPIGNGGKTIRFRLVKIGGKWLVDDVDGLKAQAGAAKPGAWSM